MTEIKNETGTKKKLLIPVVVLMLLAVGLTGAAYAYSSTLNIEQNKLDADTLTIDLTGGTMDTTAVTGNYLVTGGAVTFEDHFAYAASAKADTVKVSVKYQVVLTIKVSIGGDAACNKLYVSSSNIAEYLNQVVGNDGTNDVKISDLYSVKIGKTNVIGDATPITTDDAKVEITGAVNRTANAGEATAVTLYLFVDTALDAPKVVQDDLDSEDPAYKVASQFATAFNAYHFDLTFEATYVAP